MSFKKSLFAIVSLALLQVGLTVGHTSEAQATPAGVLLLRHAEKPDTGNELSPQGWQRAKALPNFFMRPEISKFGKPAGLYAEDPKDADSSLRPIETLQYVSAQFGETTDTNYQKKDYQAMVDQIMKKADYDGKLVVICWEHKVLADIAGAFGIDPEPKYPGDSFDKAWLITWTGGKPKLTHLLEKLLPGDDGYNDKLHDILKKKPKPKP